MVGFSRRSIRPCPCVDGARLRDSFPLVKIWAFANCVCPVDLPLHQQQITFNAYTFRYVKIDTIQ